MKRLSQHWHCQKSLKIMHPDFLSVEILHENVWTNGYWKIFCSHWIPRFKRKLLKAFLQNNTLSEKCPITHFFWSIFSHIWTKYADLLRKSLYSVWMLENTDQKNSQGYHQKRKLFPAISFVLVHLSTKKIYSGQLTLRTSIQWYHMTECDFI